MLNLESNLLGRHYVEAVRQPGIVGQLGAAFKGEQRPPIEVPLDMVGAPPAREFSARRRRLPASTGGGAVLVLHDISDLRRVDRMRRDFVANVSHELRTPLTAVRGYVEALMEEPIEPQQRRRFLEVIDRQRGAWSGWCAICCDSPARCPAGDGRGSTPSRSPSLFRSVIDRPRPTASSGSGISIDITVDPSTAVDRGGSDEDARRAPQPG